VLLAFIAPVDAGNVVKKQRVFVTVGKANHICHDVAKRVARLSLAELDSGKISNALDADNWHTTSVQWTPLNGIPIEVRLRHRNFDLDNDGNEEVIVSSRGHLRLMEYEHWDLVSRTEFATYQQNGVVGRDYYAREVEPVAQLSGDAVDFDGSGVSLGAYMVPWSLNGRNYVVFQQTTFGHRTRFGAHILVTQFEKHPYGDGSRWKPMKVICAIRDRS